MPSISDKLRSLGVKVGTQDLPPSKPRNQNTIEAVIGGGAVQTLLGETYCVEEVYSSEALYGKGYPAETPRFEALSNWAKDARIRDFSKQSFAYLDTETTGLSGGTGTYAFLIGVGRFEGNDFHLAQFFMRDPQEEPSQLAGLESFLAPCQALVTYNGKAFDLPLLNTRFLSHGVRPPFGDLAHVDLLHLARRLWRDRLPSRTLGNMEVQILGTRRTEDDIPGWMIPEMYFQYLRSGDASPMKSVFYHNAKDVLSLVGLLNHSAWILAEPLSEIVENSIDIIALAKIFEELGDQDLAIDLYHRGLELDLPEANLIEAIQRLAAIHKRQDDYAQAVPLWEKAARLSHLEAHIELAKFYEHHLRNYKEALQWTKTAIRMLEEINLSTFEKRHWLSELEHRSSRLHRKLSTSSPDWEEEPSE